MLPDLNNRRAAHLSTDVKNVQLTVDGSRERGNGAAKRPVTNPAKGRHSLRGQQSP